MTPVLSSTLLRTQSDTRLMALAKRGGERAFEAIVERYRRPLLRWCRGVLPEARAEDAVQTTFLKAWTAIQSGAEIDELRPWLYRIARNAAIDNARKTGYDYDELKEAVRVAPGPDDVVERRQVIRQTLAGVAGLPDNQRDALLQTAAGHSRAEIARELDLSEGAVRALVHRARSTLRAAATAVTPAPLASWAAALGATSDGSISTRIAELAAGAGSVGLAGTAVKVGTVLVAAGVLAVGPGADLRHEVAKDSQAAASSQTPGDRDDQGAGGLDVVASDGSGGRGESAGSRRGRPGEGSNGHRGKGSGRSGSDESGERSDSSGSGSGRSGNGGKDDHSGSGSSGLSRRSGSGHDVSGGGEDHSGSGTSGSGTSGSGTSGSGSGESGSGSGSGESGSGSGSSGSGEPPSGSGSAPASSPTT